MTRDPDTIRKAISSIEELITLELRKIELMREMRRSLMIMTVAPGIFEMGKVRIRTEGGLSYTMLGDAPSRETEFVVSSVEGPDEVRVPLFDVPMELWPEKMPAALKRRQPDVYKKLMGVTDDVATA